MNCRRLFAVLFSSLIIIVSAFSSAGTLWGFAAIEISIIAFFAGTGSKNFFFCRSNVKMSC